MLLSSLFGKPLLEPSTKFKAAVVISHQSGLMVGARSFPGNPYDDHIFSAVLEQTTNLLQDVPGKIKVVVADLGFRGVDADNPGNEIIHRGKFKSLNPQQKAWLRRRAKAKGPRRRLSAILPGRRP